LGALALALAFECLGLLLLIWWRPKAGIVGSEMQKSVEAQTPLGRTGQPQDIASVALFLASSDSAVWLGTAHAAQPTFPESRHFCFLYRQP